MTTLISWASSGGASGRCDAKCYDATGPDCGCICGGRNHGVGQERATENTRQHVETMIAGYAGMPGLAVRLADPVRQLTLIE